MRLLMVMVPAALVTFSLQMVMVTLIKFADRELDKTPTIKLPDIAMPEHEMKLQRTVEKPEKPQMDDTPPPEVPQQAFDQIDGDTSIGGLGDPGQMMAGLDLSMGAGLSASDGEYLPIVKVAPQYPRRAMQRRLEGDVILEYTVTKNGTVRDPRVVQSTDPIFNKSAVQSALRYKYKPRVVDGAAIEVPNVRTRIRFRLAKG